MTGINEDEALNDVGPSKVLNKNETSSFVRNEPFVRRGLRPASTPVRLEWEKGHVIKSQPEPDHKSPPLDHRSKENARNLLSCIIPKKEEEKIDFANPLYQHHLELSKYMSQLDGGNDAKIKDNADYVNHDAIMQKMADNDSDERIVIGSESNESLDECKPSDSTSSLHSLSDSDNRKINSGRSLEEISQQDSAAIKGKNKKKLILKKKKKKDTEVVKLAQPSISEPKKDSLTDVKIANDIPAAVPLIKQDLKNHDYENIENFSLNPKLDNNISTDDGGVVGDIAKENDPEYENIEAFGKFEADSSIDNAKDDSPKYENIEAVLTSETDQDVSGVVAKESLNDHANGDQALLLSSPFKLTKVKPFIFETNTIETISENAPTVQEYEDASSENPQSDVTQNDEEGEQKVLTHQLEDDADQLCSETDNMDDIDLNNSIHEIPSSDTRLSATSTSIDVMETKDEPEEFSSSNTIAPKDNSLNPFMSSDEEEKNPFLTSDDDDYNDDNELNNDLESIDDSNPFAEDVMLERQETFRKKRDNLLSRNDSARASLERKKATLKQSGIDESNPFADDLAEEMISSDDDDSNKTTVKRMPSIHVPVISEPVKSNSGKKLVLKHKKRSHFITSSGRESSPIRDAEEPKVSPEVVYKKRSHFVSPNSRDSSPLRISVQNSNESLSPSPKPSPNSSFSREGSGRKKRAAPKPPQSSELFLQTTPSTPPKPARSSSLATPTSSGKKRPAPRPPQFNSTPSKDIANNEVKSSSELFESYNDPEKDNDSNIPTLDMGSLCEEKAEDKMSRNAQDLPPDVDDSNNLAVIEVDDSKDLAVIPVDDSKDLSMIDSREQIQNFEEKTLNESPLASVTLDIRVDDSTVETHDANGNSESFEYHAEPSQENNKTLSSGEDTLSKQKRKAPLPPQRPTRSYSEPNLDDATMMQSVALRDRQPNQDEIGMELNYLERKQRELEEEGVLMEKKLRENTDSKCHYLLFINLFKT